ncbi:MAG TPA: hypothetical protein PLF13_05565 [candidate division Zixibacteria bacterium]|nr:hypothetical protein [candidate division Zixibacteria bacterium]
MGRRRKSRLDELEQKGFLEGIVFRWGSKLLLGMIIVIGVLTLAQCTIKKPESPTWTTQWTVPMVNRTYPMTELIDKIDQEGLEMDDSGNITYSIARDLDTVRLDESVLTVPAVSYIQTERVTPIVVTPPTVAPILISLSAITGLATSQPGDIAIIPEKGFSVVNALPVFDNFTRLTVASGQAIVTLENNLGVDLDSAIIQLYDSYSRRVIATDTFPNIVIAGHTDTCIIDLAGLTFSNQIRVDSRCHTEGGTVSEASTRYMETGMNFTPGMEVSSAITEVPSQLFEYTQELSIDRTDRLTTASLTSGQLTVTVVNGTSLSSDLTVTIPDLQLSGQSVVLTTSVAAGQTAVLTRNLNGYELIPSDITVPQMLPVELTALIPGSNGQQVVVTSTDSIAITAELSALSFSAVTGVFESSAATFDDISVDLEVPTGFDSLELVSAILTLEIENDVNLPGDLNIELVRDDGRILTISGDVEPGTTSASVVSTFINDEIAAFLSPLPEHLTARGSASFGDGVTEGTVFDNDWVFGRVAIVTPMELVLHESLVETDVESEDIDQEDIDQITEHVEIAHFVYQVDSHLPIGMTVQVFFGPDSASLYTDPQLTIGPIEVGAAPTDANGIVTGEAGTGVQEILLTNDDVQVLKNDPLYIGQQLLIHDSDGQAVKITQNDYVTINGRIEIEYLFDGEF